MTMEPSCSTGTVFDGLAGRHRIQRVPPNEKRGRRHSSEVTVTVLSALEALPVLDERDVSITFTRGSGAGGQARNKQENKVVAVHTPTGASASIDGRSQWQNRQLALQVLAARVAETSAAHLRSSRNETRRDQMSGERAFTWTLWRDQVTNHRTGSKAGMSSTLKGGLDRIL